MQYKILAICSFFVFFTMSHAVAADAPQPELAARQLWLDGFLNMSKGAQLAEQGKVTTAIQAYRDAMKLFTEVHERYPDWNTMMVAFRISSCRLHIQELEATLSPDVQNLTVEELQQRLQTEIAKNMSLAAELEKAAEKQPPADSAKQIREKEMQILELRQKVTELELKLKIEQIKASRAKTDEEPGKLRQEIADLVIQKEDNARKINELNSSLEKANQQVASLRRQLVETDKWAAEGQSSHNGESKDAATAFVAEEYELLKKTVADLRKNIAFLEENAELQLKNRQDIDKLEKMALEQEDKDEAAAAARYWHTISNKYPDSQEPALRSAYWYWLIDDHEKSNMLLDRYFSTTARNADPMILLGRVSLDQNNWQRALALTAWAAAAAPGSPDAQFSLGAVFLSNGQTPLAKACFRKAISLDAKHTDALMALAIISATAEPRNLKEAKEFYDRAVAAGHPRDPAFEAVVK